MPKPGDLWSASEFIRVQVCVVVKEILPDCVSVTQTGGAAEISNFVVTFSQAYAGGAAQITVFHNAYKEWL